MANNKQKGSKKLDRAGRDKMRGKTYNRGLAPRIAKSKEHRGRGPLALYMAAKAAMGISQVDTKRIEEDVHFGVQPISRAQIIACGITRVGRDQYVLGKAIVPVFNRATMRIDKHERYIDPCLQINPD